MIKAILTKIAKSLLMNVMNCKFLTKSTYFTLVSFFRLVIIVKNSMLLTLLIQRRQKQHFTIHNTRKY